MGKKRSGLFTQLWEAQDEAYDLMYEYDSLPHHYGENIMYQAEGHIIDLIAAYPGITITDLGNVLKKTPSACSQIVRKLKEKGWVEQSRNRNNNRQFNLCLTEEGKKVYEDHLAFTRFCQRETLKLLEDVTDEELEAHLKVQRRLNQAYQMDVRRSRDKFLAAANGRSGEQEEEKTE